MTSRINYNAPLKSVRTIRALQLEQCEPPSFAIDDQARLSDADPLNEAGVAFIWENAPGRSKVEQEKPDPAVLGTRELKPPPHQLLAPPPFLKAASPEVSNSPPPAGSPVESGTNSENRGNFSVSDHESPTQSTAGVQASTVSQPKPSTSNQLPPRPNRNRTPPPTGLRIRLGNDNPSSISNGAASASVSKRTNLDSRPLSPTKGPDQWPAGSKGEEFVFPLARQQNPVLSSTLQTLESGEGARQEARDQGLSDALANDDGRGPLPLSALNRGSQDYLTERLRHGPARLVRDFYMSGRHTGASTLPGSAFATLPNSCFPTRPNSASASETGSQSDEGEQTDVGDESSRLNMNSRELDPRCQVSVYDGEQYEAARHTDPHARDFIMERFLPAAKAMVTETDSSDRRSHHRNASLPTGGKTRPLPPGRSRFAFKDGFRKDGEGQEDVNELDELSKIKLLRQVGTLQNSGLPLKNTRDSLGFDQSPSTSVGNECSPSPAASFVNQTGSSPALSHDGQHDGASVHADSDESITPKDHIAQSFEDRIFPSNPAKSNGLHIQTSRTKDGAQRVHYRRASGNGEPSPPNYEGLDTRKDKDKGRSPTAFLRVPKDRLDEQATRGNSNGSVSIAEPTARSPEMLLQGSLGALLKSAQQRDHIKSYVAYVASPGTNAVGPVSPMPPASILNHSRYNASHAAAAAASKIAPANGMSHPEPLPSYTANGVRHEDSSSSPGQLKVNVVRQQASESSRGLAKSSANLSNGTRDGNNSPAAKSRSPAPNGNDQDGKVLTNHTPSIPDVQRDEGNIPGWPLGKSYIPYAQTPSPESKDASFSSASDQSFRSVSNQGFATQDSASSDKFSPVSVLQPPLPKSPAESWLCKVRPPLPPPKVGNWQGTKPKKTLEYSLTDDSMDVKWEVLVKSENAQRRNKLVQEHKKGSPLSAFERDILG